MPAGFPQPVPQHPRDQRKRRGHKITVRSRPREVMDSSGETTPGIKNAKPTNRLVGAYGSQGIAERLDDHAGHGTGASRFPRRRS